MRQAVSGHDDWLTLPDSHAPLVAQHIYRMNVNRWGFGIWFPWACPAMSGAWPNPSTEDFGRILAEKSKKLHSLSGGEAEVWLLIACNVGGDLTGGIFRDDAGDLQLLRECMIACFNPNDHIFDQVWLLSAITGQRLNLHPGLTVTAGRS